MGVKAVARLVPTILAAAGLWLVADGLWIPAKAALAQHLIGQAWERAQAGGTDARPWPWTDARPWPWADTQPVARLTVPRLGIEQTVLAGASGRVLAFGPGHHSGTAAPGEVGNMVISGHRDTHFRFLATLEPGDRIAVEGTDGRRRDYAVSRTEVVDHRQARLSVAADRARLTLVTCYPFDAVIPGGPLRYLVFAEATAQASSPGR